MRNGFTVEEEFQKSLIRVLTLDTGWLPTCHYSRGGWFHGADSACASGVLLPAKHWFIKLVFLFCALKQQAGQSLFALPENSPFTPARMTKENMSSGGLTIIFWDTHTSNTDSLRVYLYFLSDNFMHMYPVIAHTHLLLFKLVSKAPNSRGVKDNLVCLGWYFSYSKEY